MPTLIIDLVVLTALAVQRVMKTVQRVMKTVQRVMTANEIPLGQAEVAPATRRFPTGKLLARETSAMSSVYAKDDP